MDWVAFLVKQIKVEMIHFKFEIDHGFYYLIASIFVVIKYIFTFILQKTPGDYYLPKVGSIFQCWYVNWVQVFGLDHILMDVTYQTKTLTMKMVK